MRSWSAASLCLAVSLATVGASRITAQDDEAPPGPLVFEELEGELRIRVREEANLGMLLKGCHPYLEDTLLFDSRELQHPIDWRELTVKKSELWDRLQPILLAHKALWMRLAPNLILVSNARTGQRGELTSQARYADRHEVLSGRVGMAEIVTTIVPLRYLSARLTFTSLRQYFTNQQYESITPIDNANALLVTATGSQLREFVEILEELDRPTPVSECRFRVYPLEHREAVKVTDEVKRFLAEAKGLDSSAAYPSTREVFLALPDRQELLVYARPETIELLDTLIATLDR